MKMIMHYQKTKITPKGSKVYIGEDARPYSDGKILAVADGLGGRGGYPHSKVNPEILDKDKFYDLVFAPIFPALPSEDFIEHIYQSFNELFETAPYFFESYETIRTSGYYASRLVSIITLYLLKFSEEFGSDALFARVYELESDEEKDDCIQEFCQKLAETLKEKIEIAAENANLILESRISGAYLLPSTLTVALVDEKEDALNVIYLWAGDTRGYLWNEEEGLMQITEDHENFETMTNLITLTKPFKIEGALVKDIKKPCLLFNSSDGCYKCPVFASPFDLEYVFIDAISKNDSFENVALSLQKTFKAIGGHDDSNTMALYSYGFDSFESIKKSAKNRLENINNQIISQLPGILEIDYSGEYAKACENLIAEMAKCKEFLNISGIRETAKNRMIEVGFEPFYLAVQNKYELKGEYKKIINKDDLSIKELTKLYLSLTKEQLIEQKKEMQKKLICLVEKNFTKGVTFEIFDAYLKYKDEYYSTCPEENRGIIRIVLALNDRIIKFDGEKFILNNLMIPALEEDKKDFKECLDFLLSLTAKLIFHKEVKGIFEEYVDDFYLENGLSFAKSIFKEYGLEKIEELNIESLKVPVANCIEAQKSLAKREELYGEYEVNYKKRYLKSKLLAKN